MPNHITNIIKASPDVLAALKGKESSVDFNTLIPMPEGLNITCEGRAETLAALLTGQVNLQPQSGDFMGSLKLSNAIRSIQDGGVTLFDTEERFENFVSMLRNYRKHKCFTWYDWAPVNWGTKWNAYDVSPIEGGIQFNTAWGAPHPVILALAAKFPDERIDHSWADEDIGLNLGRRIYQLGSVTDIEIDDPIDFALTLKGRDREYYRKSPSTGKWEYYDADDKNETAETES